MISTLHLLARRSRPANNTTNILQCYGNHRYARTPKTTTTISTQIRHLATNNNKNKASLSKSQKQARASKLRKEAKDKGINSNSNSNSSNSSRSKGRSKGNANKHKKNKKFKPSISNRGTESAIQSPPSLSSSSSSSSSSPNVLKDTLKAPHMRPNAQPKKDGFKEYILKNPLFFAAFIFPTVTTGILILVKPNLRSQFFGTDVDGVSGVGGGGGGVGSRGSSGSGSKSNASVNVPADTPAAVYEGGGSGGSAGGASPSAGREDGVAEENDTEAETTTTKTTTTTTSVADLIYSIGIRPHPSS